MKKNVWWEKICDEKFLARKQSFDKINFVIKQKYEKNELWKMCDDEKIVMRRKKILLIIIIISGLFVNNSGVKIFRSLAS